MAFHDFSDGRLADFQLLSNVPVGSTLTDQVNNPGSKPV
jgi:hypothetical protein